MTSQFAFLLCLGFLFIVNVQCDVRCNENYIVGVLDLVDDDLSPETPDPADPLGLNKLFAPDPNAPTLEELLGIAKPKSEEKSEEKSKDCDTPARGNDCTGKYCLYGTADGFERGLKAIKVPVEFRYCYNKERHPLGSKLKPGECKRLRGTYKNVLDVDDTQYFTDPRVCRCDAELCNLLQP